MLKRLLICGLLLHLMSCSLFSSTPNSVVQGQRGIYQGLIVAESNINKIVDFYIKDNKSAIVYHENFITEPQIDAIRRQANLTREEKSARIAAIEAKRDQRIADTFGKIEKRGEKMRKDALENITVTKELTSSVYAYLSTSPIVIDNIPFWVEKIKQISSDSDNN